MTTQGQNKKTVRHFQCRDYLWEIFEQMSAELECSTDYLINEAMRQYARSRNYGTNRSVQETVSNPPVQSQTIPSMRPTGARRPHKPTPPPSARQPDPGILNIAASQRPASSVARGPSVPPPPPTSRPSMPQQRMPAPGSSLPPPLPSSRREPAAEAYAQRQRLFIIFNGQKIPVSKEEFVIGRSAKAADLPIKDGNISRRHAAVVFQGGAYFIKDLGSTNGIEYQGRQLDTKQIDEGDVFHLCDYELRFTYR